MTTEAKDKTDMNNEKMLMYAVEMDGAKCYFTNLKDALSSMECDLSDLKAEDIDSGLATSMTISLVTMTQEEYEALPEFEGY